MGSGQDWFWNTYRPVSNGLSYVYFYVLSHAGGKNDARNNWKTLIDVATGLRGTIWPKIQKKEETKITTLTDKKPHANGNVC